jgi:hypothetical protein
MADVHLLPEQCAKADEEGRRDFVEAVFARFVVGQKRAVDVDVRVPYRCVVAYGSSASARATAVR